MNPQTGQEWMIRHLKRQELLCWLVAHHFLPTALAEMLDARDNAARRMAIKEIKK